MITRSSSTLSALYLHYLQHFTILTKPDSASVSISGSGSDDAPFPRTHSNVKLVSDDDFVTIPVRLLTSSGSHSYPLKISQLLGSTILI